ncbi:MAG TPA: RtcB family protein [Bdellovibrionota bacterium]|nr:RtcB family protein [Bdellovibrionota bacterium]
MPETLSNLRVERIDEYRFRIPKQGGMRVDGIVFADDRLMQSLRQDQALQQVANVAHLPGIVGHSFAMPDIHWGYGFPIGGVAAFDPKDGVVSPGGVGYDINCGVRLLRTQITREEVTPHLKSLVHALFDNVPTGVGSHRRDFKVGDKDYVKLLSEGAGWVVKQGRGRKEDLLHIEKSGCIPGADPEKISDRAKERGKNQLGSLGSGNHFLEIQYVADVYDEKIANVLGLFRNQVTISVHTGSRGFGYQVCDDYLKTMLQAARKYGIELPDRQLCCAPIKSEEGRSYLAAMAGAANFAFANRQMITHYVRETFERQLNKGPNELAIDVVYDVCHNIATFEKHQANGTEKELCVHRKGATRAFPPHHPLTPEAYQEVGQPVLIPGDMGRYSFVLVGTEKAFQETFGSTCHGAGRLMSRTQAKKISRGRPIVREMEDQGIFVQSAGMATLQEEIPEAYKDVEDVVRVVAGAGLSRKVARLRPIGVVKG